MTKFGDLSYYYNKIQERVSEQQHIITRQTQFATLGELAGGIAHDLNSPLTAIRSQLFSLRRRMQKDGVIIDEENQKKFISQIENIEHSIESISTTVNSIRNQIRNTGDKPKQNFDIGKLLDGKRLLMANILREKRCTLNIEIEKTITIYGEENKLDRVITNLIQNSIDAYVQNERHGEIKVKADIVDNNCVIEVIDNAGGINEEISKDLLNKMITTKSKNEGTGFGLYYSYRIITGEFKGKMEFETKTGDGTRFIVTIPIEE